MSPIAPVSNFKAAPLRSVHSPTQEPARVPNGQTTTQARPHDDQPGASNQTRALTSLPPVETTLTQSRVELWLEEAVRALLEMWMRLVGLPAASPAGNESRTSPSSVSAISPT